VVTSSLSEVGFAIGNGETRNGVDLGHISQYGVIYGCNALYRDFSPDILVSVDRLMIGEIMESDYSGRMIYRSREEKGWLHSTWEDRSYIDKGWSAGPTAVWLMCKRHVNIRRIFLVGFDLDSTPGSGGKDHQNNIYKGTANYRTADDPNAPSRNWEKQLLQVFKEFGHIQFVRVGGEDPPIPWRQFSNVYQNDLDILP